MSQARLDIAREIMEEFARSTGLLPEGAPRRYLWTDAIMELLNLLHWARRAVGEPRQLEELLL